jgi:uncharacterized delta-60 repeat protein
MSSSSWIKSGSGSLSGATNGLSLINTGTTIVLGGNLTNNTVISGGGLYDLSVNNINEFQISSSGATPSIIGLDSSGILLTCSGVSVSLDYTSLNYGGNYRTNFTNYSLVDKGYVDTLVANLHPKLAVKYATTEDILLSGLTIVDGSSISAGDRILVKNQLSGITNGVYVAGIGVWTRPIDYDFSPSGEIRNGDLIPVISGDTQKNTLWVLLTEDPITSASTLTFGYINNLGFIDAGVGIIVTGSTILVDGESLAGNSIMWSGNTFNVDINSGGLNAALDSKVNNSEYAVFSAATNQILNSSITGATNGLTKIGKKVVLGGALTGDTIIGNGTHTLCVNTNSVSLVNSSAIGNNSVAMGGSVACNACSVAIGNSVTIGDCSVAMGGGTTNCDSTIAIGGSSANGYSSIVIGNGSGVNGYGSIVIGNGVGNSSDNSVVIGFASTLFSGNTSSIFLDGSGSGIEIPQNILPYTVIVSDLAIWNTPNSGDTSNLVLTWDSVDKRVKVIDASFIGGGTVTGGTNGLTLTGKNIGLGGDLNEDTEILLNSNLLKINNTTGFNDIIYSMILQSNGNTLIGGTFTSYDGISSNRIISLNSDGTLDTAFNTNLGTGFNSYVYSIALQTDNKILLGGGFTTLNGVTVPRGLVRFNSDGTLDTAFNANLGTGFDVSATVNIIIEQIDGKILIGGEFVSLNSVSVPKLIRLNSDGTLDTSFISNLGTGFNISAYILSIAEQTDGKILVGGSFSSLNGVNISDHLIRFNSDGTLDTAFNTNLGTGFNATVNKIYVQSDGNIIIGGQFTTLNGVNVPDRLIRLETDGTLDTTFNANLGTGFNDTVISVLVQADDKILVGGRFTTLNGIDVSNGFIRFNSDGTLDTAFNVNLGTGFDVNVYIYSLLLQVDNSIWIGGSFSELNSIDINNNFVSLTTNGIINKDLLFGEFLVNNTVINYGGNYSPQYTNRSLVDAEYVTGLTSNLTNDVNWISGQTLTIGDFNLYSANTNTRIGTIEGLYLTGATNGLTKIGKKVVLGGSLTGNTTINACTNTLTICNGKLNTTDGYQISGSTVLNLSRTRFDNVFVGVGSGVGVSNTGDGNTSVGYRTLCDNGCGYLNVAVGSESMSSNTVGDLNVAVGAVAMTSNISGNCNVAVGGQALYSNTVGSGNVSIGFDSMFANMIGSCNTAIGTSVLTGNLSCGNTGIGYASLGYNCSGNENVAVGVCSIYCNRSGSYNVALGNYAGYCSTGSSNVYLGNCSGYNNKTSNKLFIDNTCTATPLIYGEFDNDILKLNACVSIRDISAGDSSDNILTWNPTTCAIRRVPYSSGGTGGGAITGVTNGLSLNNFNAILGGTLNNNTVIDVDTFGLVFTGTTGSVMVLLPSGMTYGDDYSNNYTDRSLVDKGWVLSQISGGTTGSTSGEYNNRYSKQVVTGSTTLTTGTTYLILVNHTGSITLDLPSAPFDGQAFKIKDASGNASTHNITIDGGSIYIQDALTSLINSNYGALEIVYDLSLDKWYAISFI